MEITISLAKDTHIPVIVANNKIHSDIPVNPMEKFACSITPVHYNKPTLNSLYKNVILLS